MTPADAAKLLTLAHAYDSRKPDQARAIAWADALSGLHPNDCAEAVRRHYRTQTDWIMPAHIRALVRTIRSERAEPGQWRQLQPANPVPMPSFVRDTLERITRRRQCEHGCLETSGRLPNQENA